MASPPPNAVFTAFAFIGFLFCSIPLPWHLEAWNTGTCLYMAWTGLACLNYFINSIIWRDTAINYAPVWCDISAKFIVGIAVAIPACSLCINRRLYHIASVKAITISKAEKRRQVLVDLSIGLGIPILEMILQYIPQGHRFDIFEEVGCFPFTYGTPVAYALVTVPPLAIGLVSAVYCVLSIRSFYKSRAQFNEFLSSNSNLNSSRYVRLMCLGGVEVLGTVPLNIYVIWLNASHGVAPWKGWADTHWGFSRVDQLPSIVWRNNLNLQASVELSRWLVVLCAFIFFAFFGFADEARKNYRSAVNSIAKRVGISTGSFGSGVTSSTGGSKNFNKGSSWNKTSSSGKTEKKKRAKPVIPIFVHSEMLQRHDSNDSFTNISVSIADPGGLLSEKEKTLSSPISYDSLDLKDVGGFLNEKEKKLSPAISYDSLDLKDVGGTLADYKPSPPSPISSSSASSSSSSASSITGPDLPEPAVLRPESVHIAISSIRRSSELDTPPVLRPGDSMV